MSFTKFWRRNKAFARLAVLSQMEYRVNYFVDAFVQPSLTAGIEVFLWIAIFSVGTSAETLGGYDKTYYVAYAVWAAFTARITSTWMYEFRMIEEIESGSVNSVLVRPTSFFEYYMSQFMAYKLVTTGFSLVVPLGISVALGLRFEPLRVLPALMLVAVFLVFLQTLSFCVATVAFHFNRVHSLTVAKNLALWLLTGELIPLDLYSESVARVLLQLPFASAVYLPVGFLTGRLGWDVFVTGFASCAWGLGLAAPLAVMGWRLGVRKYVGTGA